MLVSLANGLAYSDNIYVSCWGNRTIIKFDSYGNRITFATGFNRPMGLAFDSNGYLYVADEAAGTIWKLDSNGNGIIFASGLAGPAILAFDSSGYLYVGAEHPLKGGDGTIRKFDSSGNGSIFASGFGNIQGLAFDNSSNLYVADAALGTIWKFDSNGNGFIFLNLWGVSTPRGLAFDSSGYLCSANSQYHTIWKFDSSGNGVLFASDLDIPMGLAFDSSGYLYAANYGNGTVEKFDSSGNGTIFASGLYYPYSIAVDEKTLPEKAAELAKQVIGADYLWGGKGYDWNVKKFVDSPTAITNTAYMYVWPPESIWGKGLDCSGLVFWSYNIANNSQKYLNPPFNPVHYEDADGQYRCNANKINKYAQKNDLLPGDLLFFDWNNDSYIDHVEMYVGDFYYAGGVIKGHEYPAGIYDIVSARGEQYGIVPCELASRVTIQGFVAFGRVTIPPRVNACTFTGSPVDIVLTDPDGFTVSKDIPEIPGLLYFSVYDTDENGRPDEMVTIPETKVGTYSITLVPQPNALPTDTYSLEAIISGQTMILAQNVQIQNIPSQPYEIESKLNPADFDNNGEVSFLDLEFLISHWLASDCNYPEWCEGTDLNYNGRVDFIDFALFAENWLWEKIPADIDIDGDVDFVDYAVLAGNWMNEDCAEPGWCSRADLDKSGSVDLYDLAEYAEYWLEGVE